MYIIIIFFICIEMYATNMLCCHINLKTHISIDFVVPELLIP